MNGRRINHRLMLTQLCWNLGRLYQPQILRGSCNHVRWKTKNVPSLSSCQSLHLSTSYSKSESDQEMALDRTPQMSSSLPSSPSSTQLRLNPINIQMLSKNLHRQIFKPKKSSKKKSSTSSQSIESELQEKTREHLDSHGLWGKEGSILDDVDFTLPRLYGDNIDEHFQILANKQSEVYLDMAHELADCTLPAMPQEWVFQQGWTKYCEDQEPIPVAYPDDPGIVFDMETCMTEGNFPTMAVAASTNAWYSWCSSRLVEDHLTLSQRVTLPDLIPLETKANSTKPSTGRKWTPRLVVGHNVSFDRSFVKEQYLLEGTKTRFLDTLSLHMCISGQTTLQRALWHVNQKGGDGGAAPGLRKQQKKKSFGTPATAWLAESSPNNLADVYRLYNQDGRSLDKSQRDVFVDGSMEDIRNQFQSLMTYCAKDVAATHEVFSKLLPMFFDRFPHPVTFAAMLGMGQAYLPVNASWERYLREAQETYDNLQQEMKQSLMHIANDSCNLLHQDKFSEDPWLWGLDWTVDDYKLKKQTPPKKKTIKQKEEEEEKKEEVEQGEGDERSDKDQAEQEEEERLERVRGVLQTSERIPKVNQHMIGYPMWFRELCPKKSHPEWSPGPSLLSPQTRVTPKLLRLTWDGYPLHYTPKHGWGYLVPGRNNAKGKEKDQAAAQGFPLRSVEKLVEAREEVSRMDSDMSTNGIDPKLELEQDSDNGENGDSIGKVKSKSSPMPTHDGKLPIKDVNIPGCWFYKLPHKDGSDFNVGSPLAKDFLNKVEDGTLRSGGGAQANRILEINKLISFWRNAQKRVSSQMVLGLERGDLPMSLRRNPDYDEDGFYGAIIPRVITAGTVTRRAVEPTWLTASNARTDRVGSELKSMVQCPPGYHFVGADVDSQELWIAALLGDKNFAGFHGCTAFSWMMLQGKRAEGTDMHSVTADTVGISRDHAKVINYGRIYGAGEKFAQRLLTQFNHRLSPEEARQKARDIFKATKGERLYRLSPTGLALAEEVEMDTMADGWITLAQLKELSYRANTKQAAYNNGHNTEMVDNRRWDAGSESSMFNELEEIAQSESPKTPVLDCSISRALQPDTVNNEFLTSRVNWVVQSSAVDYLHLMLVCMRWLFEAFSINGRFCISIHDEVRYLVRSEDRYRAALALQITNLLTRAMFAHKVGMDDLPQSVAFFSAVDIDTVLRKEVNMDCKTPSNPHGLHRGYGIPPGEALDIYQILELTNNGSLSKQSNASSHKNQRLQASKATRPLKAERAT